MIFYIEKEDIAKSIRFCEGLSTKIWSGKLDLSYQPEMLNTRLSTRIWKKDRSIGQLLYFWGVVLFFFRKASVLFIHVQNASFSNYNKHILYNRSWLISPKTYFSPKVKPSQSLSSLCTKAFKVLSTLDKRSSKAEFLVISF